MIGLGTSAAGEGDGVPFQKWQACKVFARDDDESGAGLDVAKRQVRVVLLRVPPGELRMRVVAPWLRR